MKKFFAPSLLVAAALVTPAFAQPVVDGQNINTTDYNLVELQTQADGFGGGARMAGLYMTNDATNLYIGIAGNLSGNSYHIFIDSKAGGATDCATDVAYGEYDDLATGSNGVMPSGFELDYYINFKSSTDTGLIDVQAGSGSYLGNNATPNAGYAFALDNSNAEADPLNYSTVDTGAELQIPLASLGLTEGDSLDLFIIAGNDNKGGNPATYMASNVFPTAASLASGNFGNDGVGGGGGDGLNYNGTGGPSVTPLTFVTGVSDVSDWEILN